MENRLKNYKTYFPNLSELEERLVEEGYLKLGFVKHSTNLDERIAFMDGTTKFSDMVSVLLNKKNNLSQLITEEEIIDYLDNPENYKELRERVRLDDKHRKASTKIINKKRNT